MNKKIKFSIKDLHHDGKYQILDIVFAIETLELCDFVAFLKLFDSKHALYVGGVVFLSSPTMKLIALLNSSPRLYVPLHEFQSSPFILEFEEVLPATPSIHCPLLQLGVLVEENVFMPRTLIREGVLIFDFSKRKGSIK